MQNLEAVGDAITGSVVARVVEPAAGEQAQSHTHETSCLNCGTALVGSYCHVCGQHSHVHRTLHAFWHDLVHGVFHFEGKIWRTLPLLVWKPGELTRRYIEGQRARFVSPIALFLFSVFLMFAVIGTIGSNTGTSPKAKADLSQQLLTNQQKIAQLQQQRTAAVKSGGSTEAIDDQLRDLQTEARALQMAGGGIGPAGTLSEPGNGLPKWVNKIALKAKTNPELLFFKLKTNAYKFSWALIPISVPFVWLLFPFSRRFKLYDHTVFVTYSLCFMMLLLSAATLVGLVSNGIASVAFFVPPIHMYRQLRGAYYLTRWGALWRASVLTIFAFIAITLFAILLIGLGVME